VFTIQSIMLVSLGFLLAMLMALLMAFAVAPAYWGRAVRLTSERMRRSLPISEAEIRADKDRLRAQHAIRVHQLETRVDAARMSAARQKVEINRRDAAISQLERKVVDLNTNLEASENARRVLEQTILDRVPRVEKRLAEARSLLSQRDREMAALQADTSKTFRALDEAMQINAQQRIEIDRLHSSLATRGSRMAMGPADPARDSDIALRSELEALRARTRDQASLISKLQELVAEGGRASGASSVRNQEVQAQVAKLDADLENAQSILDSVAENDAAAVAERADAMRELKAKVEAQDNEIEKLRAALTVYEDAGADGKARSLRDSRIALKARTASLEKETKAQDETIRRLRAELAAANDRSARQAAHYLNELRRLGAGTYPTSTSSRQSVGPRPQPAAERRRSLAERITDTVPATTADLAREPAPGATAAAPVAPANGHLPAEEAGRAAGQNEAGPPAARAAAVATPAAGREAGATVAPGGQDGESDGGRRGGLLQRIAGLGKT
jgi:hypothetical protein